MFALRSSAALVRPAFAPACSFACGSRAFAARPLLTSAAAAFARPAPTATPLALGGRLSQLRRFSAQAGDKTGPATVGEGAFERLTWEGYLTKRKYRKRVEILVAIPTTFIGLFLGISYFASQQVDPSVPLLGIEPVYVYMMATVLSGVAGYMVGPPLGAAGWRLYNRKWAKALEEMDKKFFEHITRNRADPARQTLSSSQHPIRDWYGEGISSVSGYRKWLRAQNKYKRTSI